MVQVGLRELRNNLSRYMRRVARGERLRITIRGRPVADVLPAERGAASDPMRDLVAQGRLTLPSRPKPRRRPPLEPLEPGESTASELILAEREAQR